MSFRVKLISAALNIVCMLHTLLFPSTYVMWAVLPILITAASWILVTERLKTFGSFFLFLLSVITGILCIFLGVSGSVIFCDGNERFSQYLFRFNEQMMLFGGCSMPFWKIALFFAVLLLIFFVAELIETYRNEKIKVQKNKVLLCVKINNMLEGVECHDKR